MVKAATSSVTVSRSTLPVKTTVYIMMPGGA